MTQPKSQWKLRLARGHGRLAVTYWPVLAEQQTKPASEALAPFTITHPKGSVTISQPHPKHVAIGLYVRKTQLNR